MLLLVSYFLFLIVKRYRAFVHTAIQIKLLLLLLQKFLVFTLLQHDFSVLSTHTTANIGAKIMIHKPLEFKQMKVGALKLNSFFLDKQFPIKQRGDNTCMIDFIWHQRQNKNGFKRYTYQQPVFLL